MRNVFHINTGEAKKYLDSGYINAYSLMHFKGIYEGQRSITEEKRVLVSLNHGVGVENTELTDKVIEYVGKEISIKC
jgi:hypothetical protein